MKKQQNSWVKSVVLHAIRAPRTVTTQIALKACGRVQQHIASASVTFSGIQTCKIIHLEGVLLDEIKIELEEPTSVIEEWCCTRKSNVLSRAGL